jgi:hypothetical protein
VRSEGPDFLVLDRTPSLGIEVRELFWGEDARGRPLQAAEGLEEKITDKAARLWKRRDLPPIHVNLRWDQNHLPDVRRADAIAGQLVAAVAKRLPALAVDGDSLEIETSCLGHDPLPVEVAAALVIRASVLEEAFWATDVLRHAARGDGGTPVRLWV